MVTSLIAHGRIKTTETKAKELRRHAEAVIATAAAVGDILKKPQENRSAEEQGRVISAMRQAGRVVKQRAVLSHLFKSTVESVAGRRGGYLRLIKVGNRRGDAAPMIMVELIGATALGAETPAA